MTIVPIMLDLIKIVIPKIKHVWKYVAYSMQYNVSDVKGIEKDSSDSAESCLKLFENWLDTTNGATPKSWRTLVQCIKDVDELAAAAERIITELNAKYSC